jgi:hypothetical protein
MVEGFVSEDRPQQLMTQVSMTNASLMPLHYAPRHPCVYSRTLILEFLFLKLKIEKNIDPYT